MITSPLYTERFVYRPTGLDDSIIPPEGMAILEGNVLCNVRGIIIGHELKIENRDLKNLWENENVRKRCKMGSNRCSSWYSISDWWIVILQQSTATTTGGTAAASTVSAASVASTAAGTGISTGTLASCGAAVAFSCGSLLNLLFVRSRADLGANFSIWCD